MVQTQRMLRFGTSARNLREGRRRCRCPFTLWNETVCLPRNKPQEVVLLRRSLIVIIVCGVLLLVIMEPSFAFLQRHNLIANGPERSPGLNSFVESQAQGLTCPLFFLCAPAHKISLLRTIPITSSAARVLNFGLSRLSWPGWREPPGKAVAAGAAPARSLSHLPHWDFCQICLQALSGDHPVAVGCNLKSIATPNLSGVEARQVSRTNFDQAIRAYGGCPKHCNQTNRKATLSHSLDGVPCSHIALWKRFVRTSGSLDWANKMRLVTLSDKIASLRQQLPVPESVFTELEEKGWSGSEPLKLPDFVGVTLGKAI